MKNNIENATEPKLRSFIGLSAFVLFISTVLYFPILQNDFTNWDDDKYILSISHLFPANLTQIFTSYTVGLYTPLTNLCYIFEYQLFGYNATGYHAVSLFLHLVNTILVIWLVLEWRQSRYVAVLVGLLFSIHPLNVETVAWASSRKDLLMAFFSLLSLIYWCKYHTQSVKKTACFLSALFFVLACLCKPTAIGLPIAMCLLSIFYKGKFHKNDLWIFLPFAILSLLFFCVGIYGIKSLQIRVVPETGYSFFGILCLFTYSAIFYLSKALFPTRLCNYHSYPFPQDELPWEYVSYFFLFLVLIVLIIKYYKFIWRNVPFVFLYIMLLLPVYRFYPAGYPLVAERYFYLPGIAVFLVLSTVVYSYKNKYITWLIFVSWVSLLIITTNKQVRVWKNSLTLWNNTITIYPYQHYAYDQRGKYLLAIGNKKSALSDFQQSLVLQPNNAELSNTTGNLLYELGDTSQALKYFNAAIKLDSRSAIYYYNRGNILKGSLRYKEATNDYDRAIQLDSVFAKAYNNRGIAKMLSKDTNGAYKDFAKSFQLNPQDSMFYSNYTRAQKLVK